jgi:hypothetical protein
MTQSGFFETYLAAIMQRFDRFAVPSAAFA